MLYGKYFIWLHCVIIILLTIKLDLNNAIFMMQVLIIRHIALYHNFT